MKRTSEAAFEAAIESSLLGRGGYMPLAREGYDRARAIFPAEALGFIGETQPKEWSRLEVLHGEKTEGLVLEALCKSLDTAGSLATLRHGFKCQGRLLRVAAFRPAHGLNPTLEARYAANRLGLTRQLHYSTQNENSLDVVLSLNGLPVATLELKNALTGQRTADAIRQYVRDRDPRELLFAFGKRALVHFGVDTDEVSMTTKLAGAETHFLPFNRGNGEGREGAGNPPDPAGRDYRTAYLWEEVLERHSLLELLARFLHLQVKKPSEVRRTARAAEPSPSLPRVGLMSIGTEEGKGNALTAEAHALLRAAHEMGILNYSGQIEGFQVFAEAGGGGVDVVVCDGFVGNIMLKSWESLVKFFSSIIKTELRANPLRMTGALMAKGAFTALKTRIDPDSHSGAPLLGLRGNILKAHGSSKRTAICAAICAAGEIITAEMNQHIEADVQRAAPLLSSAAQARAATASASAAPLSQHD